MHRFTSTFVTERENVTYDTKNLHKTEKLGFTSGPEAEITRTRVTGWQTADPNRTDAPSVCDKKGKQNSTESDVSVENVEF